MRLELDDEGRRELEEEQGDGEGEAGSKADGRFAQLDINSQTLNATLNTSGEHVAP